MNNEFCGRSIEEVVRKTFEGRHSWKNDRRLCHELQTGLRKSIDTLANYNSELDRLEARITRLENAIEDESATASHDRAILLIGIATALAGMHPAIRAARLGIRALNGLSTLTRGESVTATISNAIAGMGGLSIVGVKVLTPSKKRQLDDILRDKTL